jgi:hypothetical protein
VDRSDLTKKRVIIFRDVPSPLGLCGNFWAEVQETLSRDE